MSSTLELARKSGFGGSPVSVRALLQKYDTHSIRDAIAVQNIRDFHRRTGGNFGPLGASMGSLNKQSNGSYEQTYLLGITTLNGITEAPVSFTKYKAEVTLAAVKCFGTEDPSGTDETFAIISIVTVNPNFEGTDSLVLTKRTEINNNVEAGNVIFENITIGDVPAFPGSGIRIHVAIFDHEHGDADQLQDKIKTVLEDAAKKGAAALAGAAADDDPKLAGATGDIIDFEVGGVKPFKILTAGVADLITDILADDLIDEHDFFIPAVNIAEWAEFTADDPPKFPKFESSLKTTPDLPSRVQFNCPLRAEDEFLFSGGGGSYKVYFRVVPVVEIRAVVPRIP